MNNSFEKRNHIISILCTISLFCVFAISGISVVTLGANVYKGIVADMDANYTSRTCLSYLRSKIRQNDEKDSVSVAQLQSGKTALVLTQQYYGTSYETWIYAWEGSLKELFTQSEKNPDFENGQTILNISEFSVCLAQKNLLEIHVTDVEGKPNTLYINLQSETSIPNLGDV